MGPFWAFWVSFNVLAAPVWQPLFFKIPRPPFLSRGLFLHCHWRDASIAEICLSKFLFHPQLFSLDDPCWHLVSLLPKTQIKFRHKNSDRKSQTKFQTKIRQNSDKFQTNSDKIQTCLNRPKHYKMKIQTQKSRQKSVNNSDKIQTNFRQNFRQISDKVRPKFRPKFWKKGDKNSDKDSDKIQTEITVKFRHKSDRMPGLGIFGCSGSFEKVLFILKTKFQNAFCCFLKSW